jgi:hypothetical protein
VITVYQAQAKQQQHRTLQQVRQDVWSDREWRLLAKKGDARHPAARVQRDSIPSDHNPLALAYALLQHHSRSRRDFADLQQSDLIRGAVFRQQAIESWRVCGMD